MSKSTQNKPSQVVASLSADQARALTQTLLKQALAFQREGRLSEAQTLCESLLRIEPRHFDGLQLFGHLALQTNRYQLAIELLSKAIQINPKLARPYSNIGLAFQALRRFGDALLNYDKAIALEPNFVEAHNNRGNTLIDLNRPHDALISFDKAIALKPDYAEAYNGRGVALEELERQKDSLISFDKAIALEPDFVEAHSNRGNTLRNLGKPDDALISYDKAIALKPECAEAYNGRGAALMELNRLDEALISYDKAISYTPYYPEAYYRRGAVLEALNRPGEALISYDKAIALKPDYSEALHSRNSIPQQFKPSDASKQAINTHMPSDIATTTPNTSRARKRLIPPGLEKYYADYQYAPSSFADNNIIAIDGHEVRVLDRISEPEIVIFENVLSDVECELLIDLSRQRLQRTPTFDRKNPTGKGKISNERTSEGMGFLRAENALIQAIEARLAKLMHLPIENGEPLNILHYLTGAEYRPHFDFIAPEDKNSSFYMQDGGQRVATLIIYLNDVEGGGETIFPEIDFAAVPRKGCGVFFSYLDAKGKLDLLTLHGSTPVTHGEKWIATKWVRQRTTGVCK